MILFDPITFDYIAEVIMFQSNNFNHMLATLKTLIHLFKSFIVSTLLLSSLACASLSASAANNYASQGHKADYKQTNLISRAEAANPANFKFIGVNGYLVSNVMESCPISTGLINCALKKLELINGSSNEVDADYDFAQTFFFPSKAQPRTAVVVITRSGLMDDSVSAERYRVSFRLENKPSGLSWNWVQYGVQYQCARGSKAGNWSKDLCP